MALIGGEGPQGSAAGEGITDDRAQIPSCELQGERHPTERFGQGGRLRGGPGVRRVIKKDLRPGLGAQRRYVLQVHPRRPTLRPAVTARHDDPVMPCDRRAQPTCARLHAVLRSAQYGRVVNVVDDKQPGMPDRVKPPPENVGGMHVIEVVLPRAQMERRE